MTPPDTSAVERAFAVVAGTQADLYDLQITLEEHTSELTYQLRLLGMHLHRAGERVDAELIHRLYWETPSLSTQAIYEAFALRSSGEVYKIAGPHELGLPCKNCETVIAYQVKNRTELAKLRSNHRCEDCAAKAAERERQANAKSDAEWARFRQEEDEAVQRQWWPTCSPTRSCRTNPRAPMYVDIYRAPGRGGVTVRLSALNALRDELRDRMLPKD
ncbi:hypothetical protein [Kribbella sp. NPDC049227]|uniref:hypothetical protein n=1 Tax=Kribbella sp. NPDC049227 TaxID=3364113 RepID=UPI0037205DD7